MSAASYFLNSFTEIMCGAVIAYMGMNSCFEKRNPAKVFWVYFVAKAALWATFDVIFAVQPGDFAIGIIWAVITIIVGVVTYLVLFYTWNSTMLKIGIIGISIDIVAGLATVVGMSCGSLVAGGEFTGIYRGYFGLNTLTMAVVEFLVFCLLWRAARVPLMRLVQRNFVHERFLQAFVIMVISFMSAVKIMQADGEASAILVATLGLALVILIVAPMLVQRLRREQRKRELLERERTLMIAYDQAMGSQSEFLEKSRSSLDALAARIGEVVGSDEQESLNAHLAELRSTCDKLRFGSYSDCPALDTALVLYEDRLHEYGLEVDYRIAPLGEGGLQAALATQTLLEWLVESRGRESFRAGDGLRAGEAGVASLRVMRRANQLVLSLGFPATRNIRFPERLFRARMPQSDITVSESHDGSRKEVRLLVEQVAAW